MSYIAKVKLIDKDTYKKDWYSEGPAERVLFEAMEYLGEKDSEKGMYKKMIDYLIKDWEAFDKMMTPLFFKDKK